MSPWSAPHRRRVLAAWSLAALLAAPLAACSTGDGESPSFTGTAAPESSATEDNDTASERESGAVSSDASASATASSSSTSTAEASAGEFSCSDPVTHTNARFGFTVTLPCWAEPTESDNGDGLTVDHGPLQIQVYGTNAPRTIAAVKNELLAEAGTEVTYELEEGNSFTLSGFSGGRVFYVYQKTGTASANVISWHYPEDQLDTHKEAVEESVHSFVPGDLDRPH